MKIAIMGIRGIPANYGGFETFAEELAPRLVEAGHDVTVYGRSNCIDYSDKFYKGVRIVILPTISHKYLDTVVHTFLCALHSINKKYDAILICNSANAAFAWIPRLFGKPVALNVDGLEWKRAKWNMLGQWFYKISEWLSTFTATEIITDADDIQAYYLKKFKKKSTLISYGAPIGKVKTTKILDKFNVEPGKYILYVSRFEPENNPHRVVEAFEKTKTDLKLVMVGDAPYKTAEITKMKETKDPRIIFTGYVFGDGYREFQSHAYYYIQATEVGGTHPALLEGMGHGNCVLANEVPEHHEVLGDAGVFFSTKNNGELTEKMQYLIDHPEVVKEKEVMSVARIREKYTWDRVTEAYEALFARLCGEEQPGLKTSKK